MKNKQTCFAWIEEKIELNLFPFLRSFMLIEDYRERFSVAREHFRVWIQSYSILLPFLLFSIFLVLLIVKAARCLELFFFSRHPAEVLDRTLSRKTSPLVILFNRTMENTYRKQSNAVRCFSPLFSFNLIDFSTVVEWLIFFFFKKRIIAITKIANLIKTT